MSGPELETDQVASLTRWLDAVPALPTLAPSDPAAVERGRALFHDTRVACATCHGGPLLTNNKTMDVGTGKPLQVPTLRGLRWRAPFMHDGCALTLADRFTAPCGGGDRHGITSHLTPTQIADLVTFMQSL
jgi:mono/diheme cytochrome c family protein